MTQTPTSNGETHVSDAFSAEEPRPGGDPLEGSTAPTEDDFDIDLGTYSRPSEDEGINLDFGGADASAPAEAEDDIDLNFGAAAEPEAAEEEDDAEEDGSDAGRDAL